MNRAIESRIAATGPGWRVWACLAIPMVMLACRSADDFAGRRDPIPDDEYPQIAAADGLHRMLVYGGLAVRSEPGQPMSVTVGLANDTHHTTLPLQYQFEFYNVRGEPVTPVMGWRTLHLPKAVQVKITGNSVDATATSWRLVIRSVR
jgi:hypothetical protein